MSKILSATGTTFQPCKAICNTLDAKQGFTLIASTWVNYHIRTNQANVLLLHFLIDLTFWINEKVYINVRFPLKYYIPDLFHRKIRTVTEIDNF
jgi:hypothetical protein